MTTAKRGDLVVVEYHKDYGPERPDYEIERVTSVTRDGRVKATERVRYYDYDPARGPFVSTSEEPLFRVHTVNGHKCDSYRCYWAQTYVVDGIDTAAAWSDLQAMALRRASWRALTFAVLDEVRDILSAYRKPLVAA